MIRTILLLAVVMASFTLDAHAEPARSRRIALVSDPHVSADGKHPDYLVHFDRVIDEVNAAKTDLVLVAGDLTQSGDEASLRYFTEISKRFNAPVRWVAGNHDVGSKPMPGKKGGTSSERLDRFAKICGPLFFAEDVLPDVRLVAMNSSVLGTGLTAESKQWDFLESALIPTAGKATVLLTHYPPFVSAADEADDYFNINKLPRQRLCDLIEKNHVAAVLFGHLHRPLAGRIKDVPVIGAPPVSFGLPRGRQPVGWTLVTIDPDRRVLAENRLLAVNPPTSRPVQSEVSENHLSQPSDRVQIFYYAWYGAPPFEKQFIHWQQGGNTPPESIGANFYPKLGPYSSSDDHVLKQHMTWIREAGVGTLCLSWWGQGSYEDQRTPAVLAAAAAAGLKVNFHLEPYAGHTPAKVVDDVQYLLKTYGQHPAFFRAATHENKPLFYVFESVRHRPEIWKAALMEMRQSLPESVLILAQTSDLQLVQRGGFDGGYTYDGLAPFKDSKFLASWSDTARRFADADMLFVPSVGPGYWDDRAVPNGADEPRAARTRDEGRGSTYDAAWKAAIALRPPFITVTSFNEWHEGSQIEPAVAKSTADYDYPAYHRGETTYLEQTAVWARRYLADK